MKTLLGYSAIAGPTLSGIVSNTVGIFWEGEKTGQCSFSHAENSDTTEHFKEEVRKSCLR